VLLDPRVMLEPLVDPVTMDKPELPVDLDLRVMLEPLVALDLLATMAHPVHQAPSLAQLDQLDQPV